MNILKYTNNRDNIADHTTLYDVFIHKKITATWCSHSILLKKHIFICYILHARQISSQSVLHLSVQLYGTSKFNTQCKWHFCWNLTKMDSTFLMYFYFCYRISTQNNQYTSGKSHTAQGAQQPISQVERNTTNSTTVSSDKRPFDICFYSERKKNFIKKNKTKAGQIFKTRSKYWT